MTKKLFFSMVAVLLFCGKIQGQIDHTAYRSNMGMALQSAVTVSNENNYSHYLVSTDDKQNVIVTPLDNSIPHPAPYNTRARAFDLSASISDNILLRGAFFDPQDNIVAYGYLADSIGKPLKQIIIKTKMISAVAASLGYKIFDIGTAQNYDRVIVDGCWSDGENTLLYNFVTLHGGFFRLKDDLSPVDFYGTDCFYLKLTSGTSPYNIVHLCAVSWDRNNQVYILSGNKSNTSNNIYENIIGYVPYQSTLDPSSAVLHVLQAQNFTFSEYTNDHILLGDNMAWLVQDYRDNISDGLWLTQINYMTGQVHYYRFYQLESYKINLIDIAYNKNSQRLFVLGHHNGYDGVINYQKRFIAQFDLNGNYFVKYMEDVNLYFYIPTYFSENMLKQLYLCNIHFDDASESVYASGAVPGSAFLIEVFNMNNTDCDVDMPVTSPYYSYTMDNASLEYNFYDDVGVQIVNTPIAYNLTDTSICADMIYTPAPPISGEWNNINENDTDKLRQATGEISINNDGMFSCSGFAGIINYKIFDMAGRVIEESVTYNGVANFPKLKVTGIYILQTIDGNQQRANTKFVILK
ncbi:MAG: T9SS type A sorting domain-containing protein [Prevotellaceae bacterium]|jgi:hypothetical protein|nr:T9SS type A sorting domain-containing protein [Prevotellaceae bacterium]